jgi:hypothetical protein
MGAGEYIKVNRPVEVLDMEARHLKAAEDATVTG